MEKQRYQVFRTLVYHYRDGVVTESKKSLGYTWAVSEKSAIRNMRYRERHKPVRESLYGPALYGSDRLKKDPAHAGRIRVQGASLWNAPDFKRRPLWQKQKQEH